MYYVSVPDEKMEEARKLADALQKKLGIKVEIDERTTAIKISPGESDPYTAFKAINAFKALAYGFSMGDAMKLLSDDYALHVIELKDYASGAEDARRLKGRVIGEKGKTKKIIQEYTGVNLVITDNAIAILGLSDQVEIARKAVEMLLEGRQHKTVYEYLDKAELSYRMRSS